MIQVICVKWGDKYSNDYVLRLRSMVARHLPCAHEFVCYTEKPVEGVTCEPLPSDLPGWWAKVGLLKAGLHVGPCLYLDLDVVGRADLSVFVRPDDGKVWALDDFSYSLRTPKPYLDEAQKRLLGGIGTCNSSILFWHGDAGRKAWDDFTPEVMKELHGDQNWITRALYPHTLALYPPGLACSYKYHVVREGREFGSVVVFHGSPKVPDLPPANPLRVLWETATDAPDNVSANVRVRCTTCNGTGRVRDHASSTAMIGAIGVRMPMTRTCPSCGGISWETATAP